MKQKSSAEIAYEDDVRRAPLYHDGKLRKTWDQLSAVDQWSWAQNPTPRHYGHGRNVDAAPSCGTGHMSIGGMTDHPGKAAGCTKRQIEVFEQIAAGQQREWSKSIEALIAKNLVAKDYEVVGRDHFGEITVPRYYIPLPIHIQWCQWASEQPDTIEETAC